MRTNYKGRNRGIFMKSLVVAPHPDDELIGCGGTILRKVTDNHEIGWLIVTGMKESYGYSKKRILEREKEIEKVRKGLCIKKENLFKFELEPSNLDQVPLKDLISEFSNVFKKFKPQEIFIPNPNDAHSDHKISFEAVSACTKWFRYPSIKRVLMYETLSESEASIKIGASFNPNYFVNIEKTLNRKWKLLETYKSEIGKFPFPRSEKALKSLAFYRGAQSGFKAAEAFCLLREYK